MAKKPQKLDKVELDLPETAAPAPKADDKQEKGKAQASTKQANNKKVATQKGKNAKGGFFARVKKYFKDIFSELKKVDWPPMKKTKNNPGVLANLGTVLVVVAFFLVVITAFDFGLTALMRLLLNS